MSNTNTYESYLDYKGGKKVFGLGLLLLTTSE
jgi:hypothetical protein